MHAAVVTVSSSLARGEGEDRSGPRLVELCRAAGLEVSHETVSDDREAIVPPADPANRPHAIYVSGDTVWFDGVAEIGQRFIIDAALLFLGGQALISVYVSRFLVANIYGAAGGVIVLLVWGYYSAQIFLLGAEFTKVFAHHFGSHKRSS